MWLDSSVGRVFTHLGVLVLAIAAFLIYLRLSPPAPPVYVPGPTSVHTVYETKWRGKIKPEIRPVPADTPIEVLPRDQVVKESKIEDAPWEDIVAVGEVPPHAGRTTVFGTLEKGQDNVLRGELHYRQEKLPFWELKRELHGGAYYGLAGNNLAELQARLNFLRTGPVNWNAQGRVGIERSDGGLNGALLIGVEF